MHTSRKSILISFLLLVAVTFTQAQVGVGTTSPAASAKLEIASTTQGFLPPRMTSVQIENIYNPAEGLVVYDLTLKTLVLYNGSNWIKLTGSVAYSVVNAVIIGEQQWMDENLNVAVYADGTAIPEVTDPTAWENLTTGAWCWYLNDAANGPIYGKLYNWYAAVGIWNTASLTDATQRKNICPVGWHVPSNAEWTTLANSLGGFEVAGRKMKSTGETLWANPNVGATNESGFTALPGGRRIKTYGNSYVFESVRELGFWWSTNESDEFGISNYLFFSFESLTSLSYSKKAGSSVRCIKN
jgi:uncharacterized protein (TIGR02145 family)